MKKTTFYFCISIFIFLGCNKADEISKAGYFVLTEVHNSEYKSTKTVYDVEKEFSLGDIKASREFYFLISNGGENSIFDITLSTDNSHFSISPENISSLSGMNSKGAGTNIVPLIRLGVLHGIRLNGLGDAELLDMGNNHTELTITGKTIENVDTIDLESKFIFNVNAKIMDIEVYSNGQKINLSSPDGSARFGNYGINCQIPYYSAASDTIVIKNTGNVNVTINETTINDSGKRNDLKSNTLLQGQTVSVYLSNAYTILELESGGTITHSSRIRLCDTGRGYFAFFK